ncbi:MAG: PEP-CTERM sorting domain-containing protein [Cyanobacteria bacterium J06598_1]
MRIKTGLALVTLSLLSAIAPAKAATYTFEGNNLGGKTRTGDHTNILTTYNNNTNQFTWSSTYTDNGSGPLAEGAWLVVSSGENPRKNVDEYAILYLDGANEQVSIYNYSGQNNAYSYNTEQFLGSTALNVINNGSERTFEFALDATDINNNDSFGDEWKGIAFGDEIGLWFHGAGDLTTSYKQDGSLETFSAGTTGWFDSENETATAVPEPGSVAALGLFAIAAAAKRRQRLG